MVEEKGLETLQVWQKSMTLAINVQKQILTSLPVDEKWALTSQLRRSVQSISANIAEGYGRYYYQEGIHFCYLARGSLEETFTHITLAQKLGYISLDTLKTFTDYIQELRRLLSGYISFLKKSKRGDKEPGTRLSIQDNPELYDPEINKEGSNT